MGADWVQGSGDQKLTLDTRTGLEWLDLTETRGRSINTVHNGYGDWVNNGFRFATSVEVFSLLETAGVIENMDSTGAVTGGSFAQVIGSTNLLSLLNLIGISSVTYSQIYSYGWNADQRYGLGTVQYYYSYFTTIPGQHYAARVDYGSSQPYVEDPAIGSFLVRNVSPVPEPATMWFFGFAIAGFCLIGSNRRKK